MSHIIDGKKIAQEIKDKIKEKVKNLEITLAVILVGSDPSSIIYINQKEKACKEIGVNFKKFLFSKSVTEKELIDIINKLNNDKKITGILVQLPLPSHINKENIFKKISSKKDVDCFNPLNFSKLNELAPCTPKAVLRILEKENINVEGKNIVIIGKSMVVGKPLSIMLENRKANVTVCDSKTKDISQFTKQADILISSVGKPNLITKDMVKKGAVVIDVGITKINNKLIGDVDFENVKQVASKITPVPGGVGPVTVAIVLENLLILKNKQ